MRTTKRQLRKIIRENIDMWSRGPRESDEGIIEYLNQTWDRVSADTLGALGGQATWEEIGDEVLANVDPASAEMAYFFRAPPEKQDRLLQQAFGSGRRY